MTLKNLLAHRGHYSEVLKDGKSVMVYLTGSITEETAYWQLTDFIVSSRVGQQIVLIPKL